jgi:hypothetical protein
MKMDKIEDLAFQIWDLRDYYETVVLIPGVSVIPMENYSLFIANYGFGVMFDYPRDDKLFNALKIITDVYPPEKENIIFKNGKYAIYITRKNQGPVNDAFLMVRGAEQIVYEDSKKFFSTFFDATDDSFIFKRVPFIEGLAWLEVPFEKMRMDPFGKMSMKELDKIGVRYVYIKDYLEVEPLIEPDMIYYSASSNEYIVKCGDYYILYDGSKFTVARGPFDDTFFEDLVGAIENRGVKMGYHSGAILLNTCDEKTMKTFMVT